LTSPGLSVPSGALRQQWPARLLADARIVALVATSGERPVGLVRLDCGPDRIAEITLVVDPDRRRGGQGRSMFIAALEHARRAGIRRIVAWVDLGNEAALAFFGEMGFDPHEVVGDRIRMQRLVHAGGQAEPLDVLG
jgi:GNAT superfamily N-acetyltransferase